MRSLIIFLALGVWMLSANAMRADKPKPANEAPLDGSYLRDHAETRGFTLGRPVAAKPTPDGKAVLFLRAQARVPKLTLYEFDVASRTTRELLTPEKLLKGASEQLSAEEKARRERQRISVGGLTDFQISDDGGAILLSLSGKLYVIQRPGGEVQELKTGPGAILDPKFSPDSKRVAYVRDYDVYIYDLAARSERRLTKAGSERLTHGLAEFVAQEEMHRFSGYWWSPDSRFIVYEEADATGVETWHVADPARPEQPAHPTFYPRPGKANVRVRLGIIPSAGGETVWVQWDQKRFPYLASVRWGKHGPLTLMVQTRDQTELVLLKVKPETGQTTALVSERDAAWVHIHPEMPRWLADDRGFLWVSEARGAPELEWRRTDGKLERVLTSQDDANSTDAGQRLIYRGLADVNADSGQIVYEASANPTRTQLFSANISEQKARPLTSEPGIHHAVFARNHAVYVRQSTTAAAMPRTPVHQADGTLIAELPSVAENPPFVPRAETVKIGKEPSFYCSIVRPHNFESGKRYPVIVDVYGGPGFNRVVDSMGSRLLDQWLADQGFIVVSMDGRGTPGRGRDWERAIAKHFGSVPLEDQVAALNELGKRFPELDLDRVGIVGWSFGGYMSALAVLKRPDVFKAAVAGAPVVDWLDYDTHYTERYLGLPHAHPDAYKEASLLTYADSLHRPLLIIHGTADDNVYFRHSLKLVNALFRAGKDFDLLPLSGFTHMVPDPVVMERMWTRIARHFQKHLAASAER